MKKIQSLWMLAARLKLWTSLAELSAFGCALVVLGVMLAQGEGAIAQQQSSVLDSHKAQLEVQKLELEVKRLADDPRELPEWLYGLLAGVTSTLATIWLAWRARHGELDQSVHEKRLELYPQLAAAGERLALYFPPEPSVDQYKCRLMGKAMRAWYFKGGGLLMSTQARDAYFDLARALTRASSALALKVPDFPKDAMDISAQAVEEYRRTLATRAVHNVEWWDFGGPDPKPQELALRFKDFVFLQGLSSALRTRLCEDLYSRRRPS
jgi:hypothetical protein